MRPYPLALRQTAHARLSDGTPLAAVAAELGLSVATLRRWERRWQQTGSLAARSPPGRSPVLPPALLAALTAELRTHPTMTLAELRGWLQATSAVTVSRATIHRALHRLGWRFQSLR